MVACHLRNKEFEVADIEVQDSVILVGKNTQSISVVSNNDNDNRMSAQMQSILAGVFSILNSVQSQKAKTNEELGDKLMAESHKLADKLTEKLHHEVTKVTEAICQLREET
jgi:hypothetical protein